MKQILVTGGLGYIGSHTAVQLIEAGYQVVFIDNLSNSNLDVLNGIERISGIPPVFYEVDVKDSEALTQLFNEYSFVGVIHFAAYKSVRESVENPLKYYRNNILGLVNLLEVMDSFGVKHFIFSSSCTVYGQADGMPINELTPLKKNLSPYGKTKQIGEEIVADWVIASKTNAIILRYFNPIGAHPSLHIGESIEGEPDNLIPYIIKTALKHYDFVKVFGNDYPTKDGTAIRDYIDVNDLAEAHVKALNQLVLTTPSSMIEYYNLGTGKGYSVLEMIQAFEKVVNINIPYQFYDRRAADLIEAYADYALAKVKLKWTPNISLEESVYNAWMFYKMLNK